MLESELIELFEYKVADVQQGLDPKGGKRSINELRERLLGASLDASLLRRLRAADRLWKACQQPGNLRTAPLSSGYATALGASAQETGDALGLSATGLLGFSPSVSESSGERNEWDVLGQLRAGLYHAELRAQARQQARIWLKEPRLSTLRLAFALTENLERGTSGTAVPPLRDAFSSLHDPDIAVQVLTSLARQLSVQAGELPERYFQIRSALSDLADSPFARGNPELDTRVQAAEREQLSQTVKKALILALVQSGDAPRSATEQPSLRSAAGHLLAFLESVIPRSSGGQGPEWPLLDGLLFARGQSLRLRTPGEQALSLAIHLPGGEQTTWRGQTVSWRRVMLGTTQPESGWELRLSEGHLGGAQIVRLSARKPEAESQLGGQPLRLVLVGDDLALELRPTSHTDLFPLALEARLTAALLEPGHAYANLRLARATAQRLRQQEINAEKVSEQSAERYAAAPPETLLSFARQGAQALLTYAAQGENEALARAFAEARTFLALSRAQSEALLGMVRRSLLPGSLPIQPGGHLVPEVASAEEHALLSFRGEPLTVRVMGRPVTLRNDFKGELCAVIPGLPVASVRDLLVVPVPNGAMTVIRAGERVVVGFQPLLASPEAERVWASSDPREKS